MTNAPALTVVSTSSAPACNDLHLPPADPSKGHHTGAKFVWGRKLADISADIRRDVAADIKSGALPAGLVVSVKTNSKGAGRSIVVRVTACPFPVRNPARIEQDRTNRPAWPLFPFFLPEGVALLAKVESIAKAYHYDRSDTAVDHFCENFHLSVDFDGNLP